VKLCREHRGEPQKGEKKKRPDTQKKKTRGKNRKTWATLGDSGQKKTNNNGRGEKEERHGRALKRNVAVKKKQVSTKGGSGEGKKWEDRSHLDRSLQKKERGGWKITSQLFTGTGLVRGRKQRRNRRQGGKGVGDLTGKSQPRGDSHFLGGQNTGPFISEMAEKRPGKEGGVYSHGLIPPIYQSKTARRKGRQGEKTTDPRFYFP